jgi:hypothetical protein
LKRDNTANSPNSTPNSAKSMAWHRPPAWHRVPKT